MRHRVMVALVLVGSIASASFADDMPEKIRRLQTEIRALQSAVALQKKKIASLENKLSRQARYVHDLESVLDDAKHGKAKADAAFHRATKEIERLKTANALLRDEITMIATGRIARDKIRIPASQPVSQPAHSSESKGGRVLVGPVRAGDVKIAVSGAFIGKAPLHHKDDKDDEEDLTESKENYLIIGVRISNISERKKTDFRTWGALPRGASGSPASLTDELGNKYKPIHFGPSRKLLFRKDSAVIYPRKSLVDVLIFSLPPKKIRVLKLSLPLGNVGGKGQITLKIPTALVTGILGLK